MENIISKRNYVLTVLFCSLDILLAYLILYRLIRIKIRKDYWIFFKIHLFPSHVNKMTHFNYFNNNKTFHTSPLKIIISDDKILANVAMTKNWAFCMSLLLSQNCSNPVILLHDHLATIIAAKVNLAETLCNCMLCLNFFFFWRFKLRKKINLFK